MTGYPSVDKPWLKYYSKEAVSAEVPLNRLGTVCSSQT